MIMESLSTRQALNWPCLLRWRAALKVMSSCGATGFIHRDISINNLMINKDNDNLFWLLFLIDLDFAVREQREGASGAKGKTGTRAFMAIGALLGEQHSFMHDLESFFWVLFWICIHYDGPRQERVVRQFDKWNYVDMEELAKQNLGTVAQEAICMRTITDHFTPYYQPLIPLLGRLRKMGFPGGGPWEREKDELYSRMREALQDELTLMSAPNRSRSPDVPCDTTVTADGPVGTEAATGRP